MKVKILRSFGGAGIIYSQDDIVEMEAKQAAEYIKCGFVEEVKAEKPKAKAEA